MISVILTDIGLFFVAVACIINTLLISRLMKRIAYLEGLSVFISVSHYRSEIERAEQDRRTHQSS